MGPPPPFSQTVFTPLKPKDVIEGNICKKKQQQTKKKPPTSIPGPHSAISCPCGWGRCCACEWAWTWWRGCVWAWCVSTIAGCGGYRALGTEGRVWGPGYPAIWAKTGEERNTHLSVAISGLTASCLYVFDRTFSLYLIVSRMLGAGVKTFTGTRTRIPWPTGLQREWRGERERERVRQTEIKTIITLISLCPHTEEQDTGHSHIQHTNLQMLFVWPG